jgi:DNA gyrase subunit B
MPKLQPPCGARQADMHTPLASLGHLFLAPDGLLELLRHQRKGQPGLHEPIQLNAQGTLPEDNQRASFDIVLLWDAEPSEHLSSFVNEKRLVDRGPQIIGLLAAVTRAVKQFARGQSIDVSHCTGDNVRECLTAIISMHLVSPEYGGSLRSWLNNPGTQRFVQTLAYRQLLAHLRQHPDAARRIVARVLQSADERLAAQAARKQKSSTG